MAFRSTTTSPNVSAKGSAVSEVKAGTDSTEGKDLWKENCSPTDAATTTTAVEAPGTETNNGTTTRTTPATAKAPPTPVLYSRCGHSRGNSSVDHSNNHYNRGGGYSGNSSLGGGHCCSTQSHKYTTGQLPRHSTRQRRQSNHCFVTEYIETTASVSCHKSHSIGHRYGRDGGFSGDNSSADSSLETDNRGSSRGGLGSTTNNNSNNDRAYSEVVSGGCGSIRVAGDANMDVDYAAIGAAGDPTDSETFRHTVDVVAGVETTRQRQKVKHKTQLSLLRRPARWHS